MDASIPNCTRARAIACMGNFAAKLIYTFKGPDKLSATTVKVSEVVELGLGTILPYAKSSPFGFNTRVFSSMTFLPIPLLLIGMQKLFQG